MPISLLGIVLFLAPFSLIFIFKNHYLGFLSILGLSFLYQISLALLSQLTGTFSWLTIFLGHSVLIALTLILLLVNRKRLSYKKILNPLLVLVSLAFLIIAFEFWSVHYNYTGTISTITGQQLVINKKMPYPYFSDEWVGTAIVKKTIDTQSLISGNPLAPGNHYSHYHNPLLIFFSLLAELTLLFNLPISNSYSILLIIFSTLICLNSFIFLRINKVNLLPALIATLSLPFIANSGNLPGLWTLLPFSGGLLFFIPALSSLSLKRIDLFILFSFLTILMYPPLIVFVALSALAYFIINKKISWPTILFSASFLIASLLATWLIFYFQNLSLSEMINFLRNSIWREYLDPGIVSYPIWRVVPIASLLAIVLGIKGALRKNLLTLWLPLVGGLVLWSYYSYSGQVLIISPERVVIIVSLLLVIISGFTLDKLLALINYQRWPEHLLIIACLGLFTLLSVFYTNFNVWDKFYLTMANGQKMTPNPPATIYLNPSDLNLFSSLDQQRFIAPPWKGLAIGALTTNYPLQSKPSFFTNNYLDFEHFFLASCEEKINLALQYKIDYVYSPFFACQNFASLGKSSENIYLYKFEPHE